MRLSACCSSSTCWLTASLALLAAGCLSPKKKVAERLPSLRSQWTSNVVHQAALPEETLEWPTAVARLREQNLKLRAARLDITNSQEGVRQVYKDLIPTVNLRASVSRSLKGLGSISFDDVTFSVDSFFNVPGVVNMSARYFSARLTLMRAEMAYHLIEREQMIELYKLFLGFEEAQEVAAELHAEEELAKAIRNVDAMAGDVLLEELKNRRLAWEKQRDSLQGSAGDLLGDRGRRWLVRTNGWPAFSYLQQPLPLEDSNRVAQLQMKLVAVELVGAWAQIKGIKLQYWPELTIFVTGPPVYQRQAGMEHFFQVGALQATADLFWRLDTRGYITRQLRQARRDQKLQWSRLREESLALMDKLLAAQKFMSELHQHLEQVQSLLPLLESTPPPADYTGILKAVETARTVREQERKLRRDLAELNTLFWFVDERQWAGGKN